MNESRIHDALGELPEDLLAPVEKLRRKRKLNWVKWASLAACLCLLAGLPMTWFGVNGGAMEKADSASMQESPAESGILQDSPMYKFEEDMEYAGVGVVSSVFRAKVLEVQSETAILVEPLEEEAERLCSDKFEIGMQGMESVPEIHVGDIVEITYDGMIQESYPARIPKVFSVRVVE